MSLQNKLTHYLNWQDVDIGQGTALQAVSLLELKHKTAAPKSTVNWHNKTELPELQYFRNGVSGFRFKSQLLCLLQVPFNEIADQAFFQKEDNYESMGCFPDNSPSLERWCSILLARCIHVADCKVLGDFLHILKVEERIETSFILGRKRKYEIIMLKEILSLQL